MHLGLEYRPQDYDCDDFARFAATLAGLCHRRTPHQIGALAFGECWFLKDGFGLGHAINVAIVAGPETILGVKTELFFYDPQTFGPVDLDPVQLATVEFIRF